MRVLLVTGAFPPMPCGVGDYTEALARALADVPGVQVAVLTSEGADPERGAGRFEVFPLVRTWASGEFRRVEALVRRWAPDLVHVQFPSQGYHGNLPWQLPIRLQRSGFAVVQTWHEYQAARIGGWVSAAKLTFVEKLRLAVPQVALAAVPGDVIVVRADFMARMPRWYRLLRLRDRLRLVPNGPMIPRAVVDDVRRAALRARYGATGRALLAFFGFAYEHKGIDDILAIMDPGRHHLVIVGDLKDSDPYQRALLQRVRAPPLADHVSLSGFLPAKEAAEVLASADAVLLPYRDGAGPWNSTLKAAALQGTFVLTTSVERHGFEPAQNVYYARPRDLGDLRQALDAHLGVRIPEPSADLTGPSWAEIAERHVELYRRRLPPSAGRSAP